MNYSDKHKLCWVTPIRTATRSSIGIQKFFDFDILGTHCLINYQDKRDYDIILNIRSPYQRIVSIFHLNSIHLKKSNLDFKNWLFNIEINSNQYEIDLYKIYNKIHKKPEFLIKVEFFHKHLLQIPIFKQNEVSLKEVIEEQVLTNNYSNEFFNFFKIEPLPWQSYYNQELADFVYSITEKQFEFFNYNRDYWKDGTP